MLEQIDDIGRILRNAVAFNPRYWKGTDVNPEVLLPAVRSLFALLQEREIPYVLVGGVALLNYIEGRNTEDLDLILALADLQALPEIEVESQDEDFARGTYQGLRVDILLTENPLFRLIRDRYTARQTFLEQSVPLATVEGLLLRKLYALSSLYRQGRFERVSTYENDIAVLMYAYEPDVEALLQVLADFVSESDLRALGEIVAEIRGRIERFRERREGSGPVGR